MCSSITPIGPFCALCLQTVAVSLLILAACLSEQLNQAPPCTFTLTNYFHFGPSDNLCFITLRLDTWVKWLIMLFLCLLLDAASTLVDETVPPWVNNVLTNPKVEYDYCQAQAIQQLYYINFYLRSAINTFVALTQVDILLCSLACACVITAYTTHGYLQAKQPLVAPLIQDIQSA